MADAVPRAGHRLAGDRGQPDYGLDRAGARLMSPPFPAPRPRSSPVSPRRLSLGFRRRLAGTVGRRTWTSPTGCGGRIGWRCGTCRSASTGASRSGWSASQARASPRPRWPWSGTCPATAGSAAGRSASTGWTRCPWAPRPCVICGRTPSRWCTRSPAGR